jgi:protocatechuate 3,4-dioxygenase beta subunit
MTSPDHHHSHHSHADEVHEHDLGLQHDVRTLQRKGLGRRGLLGVLGGLGAAGALAACSTDTTTSSSGGRPPGAPPDGGGGAIAGESSVDVADGEVPEETAGPYPGDGSNGPNVLSEEGIVRQDITSSFGSASGVAEGVPLTLRFKVYDLSGDDVTVLPGAALYAWHCDRGGSYSMYDGDAAEENYLRGVQVADEDGWLSFTTIFPACYAGRWPHVHFEVYESVDTATSASSKLRTSQLALPQDVCEEVYATDGYEQSVANLAAVSLDSDGIFADGYSLQMATVTGSLDEGYVATLKVPI